MSKKKIGNVWIFIEQDGGKIADVSLELVCKGTELAKELGVKTEAVLLGHDVGGLTQKLHEFGCDNVFVADHPGLKFFTALSYTKVIVELIKAHTPNIFMFGATPVGRSLAPRIASTVLAGLTADCTELKIDSFDDKASGQVLQNKLMQIRPAFGGNIIATIVNSWDDPQMVTVREGVMKLTEPVAGRKGAVTKVDVKLSDEEMIITVIERFKQAKTVNLKAAQIIVAGGYGMGDKDGFDLCVKFAEAIGGSVAASRAAVDAGWINHDYQVGQTGVTVRPRLYIACGISGSVQHRAGMSESSKIIAINNDPNAPIFSIADYGIVGDVKDVIAKFIKAYKGHA
jgi:electron transfer flavoprotein alpha subunit